MDSKKKSECGIRKRSTKLTMPERGLYDLSSQYIRNADDNTKLQRRNGALKYLLSNFNQKLCIKVPLLLRDIHAFSNDNMINKMATVNKMATIDKMATIKNATPKTVRFKLTKYKIQERKFPSYYDLQSFKSNINQYLSLSL